jgi:hypothetical protein
VAFSTLLRSGEADWCTSFADLTNIGRRSTDETALVSSPLHMPGNESHLIVSQYTHAVGGFPWMKHALELSERYSWTMQL